MKTINRRDFFKTGALATAAGATIGVGCTPSNEKLKNETLILEFDEKVSNEKGK